MARVPLTIDEDSYTTTPLVATHDAEGQGARVRPREGTLLGRVPLRPGWPACAFRGLHQQQQWWRRCRFPADLSERQLCDLHVVAIVSGVRCQWTFAHFVTLV